ncbi:MAG: M56 family metallopeptidase [Litorimonas sp.]
MRRLLGLPFGEPDPALIHRLDRICALLGVTRTIELRISSQVRSVCTVRSLRPVIFVPLKCLTGLSSDELSAVLAHELAHIRRHDVLWAWVRSILRVLFYYHPCTHYLIETARREAEFSCDALAIRSGASPHTLAKALVGLGLSDTNALVQSAPASRLSELELRVERLTGIKRSDGYRQRPPKRLTRSAWGLAPLTMAAIFALIAFERPVAHDTQQRSAMNYEALVAFKDAVCLQIKKDDLYWNQTYDQGGPVEITLASNAISMNSVPLPEDTQSALRPLFDQLDVGKADRVSVRYYHEDIELTVSAPEPSGSAKAVSYRTMSGSTQITRVSKTTHHHA